MNRSLTDVIDAIVGLIPDTYSQKKELTDTLEDQKSSVSYAAPETQDMWWEEVSDTLGYFIKEPKEDWQLKIVDVFCGKTDYKKILLDKLLLTEKEIDKINFNFSFKPEFAIEIDKKVEKIRDDVSKFAGNYSYSLVKYGYALITYDGVNNTFGIVDPKIYSKEVL